MASGQTQNLVEDNATSPSTPEINRCSCGRDFKSHSTLVAHIERCADEGHKHHKEPRLNSLPIDLRRASAAHPANWPQVLECDDCDQIFGFTKSLATHKGHNHAAESTMHWDQ